MATKQTLNQAIKAVRAFAKSKGETYFSVSQKWQSIYNCPEDGVLTFTAYVHGFTHVDSPTIEGLIDEFKKYNYSPIVLGAEEEDDLTLPF